MLVFAILRVEGRPSRGEQMCRAWSYSLYRPYNGICGRNIYLEKVHHHLKGSPDPQWSDEQRGQRWWREARTRQALGPKSS